jgi:hypothetical protein
MNQTGNYNGRQPNNTAFVKTFVSGIQPPLWTTITYKDTTTNLNKGVITPSSRLYDNLYIPGNIYLDGSVITPSDIYLKDNIEYLSNDVSNNLMNIRPTQFVLKADILQKIHYGFIAQEFEEHFPELVTAKVDNDIANLKAINYTELIPLLVHQIQKMQKEIDDLKEQINGKNLH